MLPRSLTTLVLVAACGMSSLALAQDKGAKPVAAAPAAKAETRLGDAYYLATCPMSGEKLGGMGEAVIKVYDGRETRFCCKDCVGEFEKDKTAGWAKVDALMIKDQLSHYPVDTSIVSGKKLGEKPVDFVWNNRLVRLADEGEKAAFLKDTPKFMAALDAAVIKKQSATYTLTKCPVMGDDIEKGGATNFVVANRLVELCCKKCLAKISKNPAKFVAMVDSPGTAAAPAGGGK